MYISFITPSLYSISYQVHLLFPSPLSYPFSKIWLYGDFNLNCFVHRRLGTVRELPSVGSVMQCALIVALDLFGYMSKSMKLGKIYACFLVSEMSCSLFLGLRYLILFCYFSAILYLFFFVCLFSCHEFCLSAVVCHTCPFLNSFVCCISRYGFFSLLIWSLWHSLSHVIISCQAYLALLRWAIQSSSQISRFFSGSDGMEKTCDDGWTLLTKL